ncbi:MAG TPA: hypothetical protein VFZ16_06810 [Hyphomicrobiaceae bacterium]|nr:hypothetical protein [Hyphomicrobiaceae bacterium]
MRSLFLLAGLLLASPVLAQEAAQSELNALTGAPAGTRCFQSMAKAQEMARQYIASGLCPRQLSPIDPAEFMEALEQQKVVDDDFTSDACQVQLKLMFRAGREWIGKDPDGRCHVTAQEMRKRPYFKSSVR